MYYPSLSRRYGVVRFFYNPLDFVCFRPTFHGIEFCLFFVKFIFFKVLAYRSGSLSCIVANSPDSPPILHLSHLLQRLVALWVVLHKFCQRFLPIEQETDGLANQIRNSCTRLLSYIHLEKCHIQRVVRRLSNCFLSSNVKPSSKLALVNDLIVRIVLSTNPVRV